MAVMGIDWVHPSLVPKKFGFGYGYLDPHILHAFHVSLNNTVPFFLRSPFSIHFIPFQFDFSHSPSLLHASLHMISSISSLGTANSPLKLAPIVRYSQPPVCFNLGFRSKSRFGVELTILFDQRRMDWIGRMAGGCFKERPTRRLEVEFDSCGEDVFDAGAMESGASPEHLVIMVNGLVGSAADWKYAAEQFVKKLPDKVIVHRSKCNYSKLTFDGVDLMGERLAEEVLSVVKHRTSVRKISFVAHSLGGLVARYAIGRLYECPSKFDPSCLSRNSLNETTNNSMQCLEQPYKDRIAGLEPMNFITFATPHLGSRGHKQLPFLCGLPFLERRASQTAHLIVGRTGNHLFLTDCDDGKPPLLLRMVNDSDDVKFISALHAFKRRVAYANANYDHIVGWSTSSIRRQHELPKMRNIRILYMWTNKLLIVPITSHHLLLGTRQLIWKVC
ncbi:uncharacterized protein LOC110811051 isoform X2 [Carica papaya]|uniref:uncharacterized protein LOC110811051 isoform X2 n=1 Tax=Carica papaya TaxID=3649 RepID=UPI000B8CC96E|nr:uncharacterized protein LOC110811051 isoform X2 [Carica papaya]